MENLANILNGDIALYIMAAMSVIITLEQYLGKTERFKANSSLQAIANGAKKILKFIGKA
ncbi:MAG: hypothetical protein KAV87_63315 [Desulfobacteraceae bacterium]|nr:hypothetical protein [Desulfobacteraceae bacterium]